MLSPESGPVERIRIRRCGLIGESVLRVRVRVRITVRVRVRVAFQWSFWEPQPTG